MIRNTTELELPARAEPSAPTPAGGPRRAGRRSSRRRPAGRRASVVLPVVVSAGLVLAVGLTMTTRAGKADHVSLAGASEAHVVTVGAMEDTYVTARWAKSNFGSSDEISAVGGRTPTLAYLKFRVTGVPSGATVTSTRLSIKRTLHHLSGRVGVSSAPSTWQANSMTWENRLAPGDLLTSVAVDASSGQLSIDVPDVVTGDGVYTLVLSSPNPTDSVRFRSIEDGSPAPSLTVTYAPTVTVPQPVPTPSATATATAPPSASPSPTPPPVAAPTLTPTSPPVVVPPTDPPGTVRTLWGVSPGGLQGESPDAAFARIDAAFGGTDAVRWWPADGSVPSWSALPSRFGQRALSMSMKLPPADVAAGKYDSQLATFFSTAPKDRLVLATFYHEPEDNIAAGEFTVDQYKAAWVRFSKIARANAPANLKTTMILMAGEFRNNGNYGHDWRWYIVPGTFDVLGGDDYQFLSPKVATAADVVGPHMAAAAELKVPFAILELGARSTAPDRARFLSDVIRMTDGKALMVLAFESYRGNHGPWNIIDVSPDAASVWRAICMRS